MKICDSDKCTGCGACLSICTKNAILFTKDIYGTLRPDIDEGLCVRCGQCVKVCPNNQSFSFKNPLHTYAAWSTDDSVHANSASGGIATEIYLYALEHNIFISGTRFERDCGVVFQPVASKEDITWARDSKYVYSNMRDIYKFYEQELKDRPGIFIGLPCQVAALKSYFRQKKLGDKNIIFIELICHGVPNWKYLNDHLSRIEKQKKQKVNRISFRDPLYIFFFKALAKNGKILYRAGMHEGDEYYRAFALNLIFRDNCYCCPYARKERIADITLGDFSGLGRENSFPYPNKKISVVLGVTEKGNQLLKAIENYQQIKLVERPYEEAYLADGNSNLRHPSVPHRNRYIFLDNYKKTADFDASVEMALKAELEEWRKIRFKVLTKRAILALIPRRVKNMVKSVIGVGDYK